MGVLPSQTDPPLTEHTVQELLSDREEHIAMLKNQLAVAQNRMKLQADKHRVDRTFQVGEQVLLKLQPYVQASVVNHRFPKLSYKFFGPYTVLERIGCAAYKLDLPPDSKVHNVFHVSQLKPFNPDFTPVFSDIQKLVDLSVHNPQPEALLQRCLVKKGNTAIPQVLTKWTGFSSDNATWEDLYVLKQRFPLAAVWGQSASQGGEDVMAEATPKE